MGRSGGCLKCGGQRADEMIFRAQVLGVGEWENGEDGRTRNEGCATCAASMYATAPPGTGVAEGNEGRPCIEGLGTEGL